MSAPSSIHHQHAGRCKLASVIEKGDEVHSEIAAKKLRTPAAERVAPASRERVSHSAISASDAGAAAAAAATSTNQVGGGTSIAATTAVSPNRSDVATAPRVAKATHAGITTSDLTGRSGGNDSPVLTTAGPAALPDDAEPHPVSTPPEAMDVDGYSNEGDSVGDAVGSSTPQVQATPMLVDHVQGSATPVSAGSPPDGAGSAHATAAINASSAALHANIEVPREMQLITDDRLDDKSKKAKQKDKKHPKREDSMGKSRFAPCVGTVRISITAAADAPRLEWGDDDGRADDACERLRRKLDEHAEHFTTRAGDLAVLKALGELNTCSLNLWGESHITAPSRVLKSMRKVRLVAYAHVHKCKCVRL